MTERERLLKWYRVYSYKKDDLIAFLETCIGADEIKARGTSTAHTFISESDTYVPCDSPIVLLKGK